MITIVSLSLVSGIVTKSSIEKYQILIGRHLLTGDDTVTQPDESVIELFEGLLYPVKGRVEDSSHLSK